MPPGPGYKEFFPAATRAAKNKATEREKARTTKPSGSPPDLNGRATPSLQNHNDESAGTSSRRQRDGSHPDILRSIADENDSVSGDILHTVGSASSTESSSTVFSSAATHQPWVQPQNPNLRLSPRSQPTTPHRPNTRRFLPTVSRSLDKIPRLPTELVPTTLPSLMGPLLLTQCYLTLSNVVLY